MTIDLELVRSRNPIEDIVGEIFPLKKTGKRFIGVEHDSLVVIPQTGSYFWNSQGEKGDVFDFVGRHVLGNHASEQFLESVHWLAQRANLPFDDVSDFRQSPVYAERQQIQRLHETLLNTPATLHYVTEQRGWQLSTSCAARLGYIPRDRRKLLSELNLPQKWQAVIQKFPSEMIVYVHLSKGRLTYLSGRSITGKKHYNPPHDIIGERQPYYNYAVTSDRDYIVVVEGQADAISFAEWDIPAVALGGMQISDELLKNLRELWSPLVALVALFEEQGGIDDLLAAISEAAEWDEQTSEGKALGEREEAVLQALEVMTRNKDTDEWIKAAELRAKVRELLGYNVEQMGHAQWIGHILNRLQLTDKHRRKAYTGGQIYLIARAQVLDMMRRYEVEAVNLLDD